MKKSEYAVLLLILLLCTGVCCHAESAAAIPLGDGLPDWVLDEPYSAEKLPATAGEQGLSGIYTTDAGLSDVYVYSFSKDAGVTLEEFGQQLAAQRNIFCNMTTDRGVPAAVLNYFDRIDGEPYIVQAYIYETGKSFVEVCTRFSTEAVPLGGSALSIHMISEYDPKEQKNAPLLSDTVYRTDNERLPQLRICQFSGDNFPAELIDPELPDAVSDESYAALAEDGWTLEEFVAIYDASHELLKGEVTCRNDLDHAFIGYIDDGVFHTRAFIDDGEDYILLGAEAETSKFQHVTNALIDAIE